MENVAKPSGPALTAYIVLGALIGLLSVLVTRAVYAIEDGFEELPIHWMWWPALGGLAVGILGYFAPRTLGVGYVNIEDIVSGHLMGSALLFLVVMKFLSWSISLGSGTSGGTLAPLFTIGGGAGSVLGLALSTTVPSLGVDPRIAGLVGMAAIFAGASRALLASVVFAFETTLQPMGLLPLLGGCTAAYLVSSLLMKHTIMTEKIARRGVKVPAEYSADYLEQVMARTAASRPVVTLNAGEDLGAVRRWLASEEPGSRHQGYPVVNASGDLVGVVTRRNLLNPAHPDAEPVRSLVSRPPAVVYEDSTLREAADHMLNEDIGRLPVVSRDEPHKVVGILTRSDLLKAHRKRLDDTHKANRHIRIRERLGNLELKRNGR
jgi:CBS domain-containing protein